ncbi:MAG: transglycosylase SLT domain-containing protein [Candidatus Zixiibacteriota bacterium]|nr:MAG: transglycosylase SLT domain-containing protein [candidate division Zixibacteria bacterium]
MKIYNPNIARFLVQSKLDELSKPPPDAQQEIKLQRLKKACRDFEAIFISYMLKAMNKTTENSDLFGSGLGGDIYREIFNEKLAEHLSQTGQFKIGDIIYQKYAGMVNRGKENADSQDALELKDIPPSENMMTASGFVPLSPEPDRTGTEIVPRGDTIDIGNKSGGRSGEKEFLSEYKETIEKAASEFGLAASLIKAVIKQESAGDPEAVSRKGAKGLMQLIDSTATMLGVRDPFNPAQNIMGGAKYLSMLIKRFGGDLRKALASYNAGPAAVEKYKGVPPFPETIKYVENVLSSMSME